MNIIKALVISLGVMVSITSNADNKLVCNATVPVISTQYGKICGIEQEKYKEKSYAYLGIPFAKPPVKNLRWKNPEVIPSWKPKTLQATKSGSMCVQPSSHDKDIYVGNEDCLYLNVWVPENNHKPLPVMVFIPGGGFMAGSGGLEIYNGTYMSAYKDVIVVTLNYRLGVLGYLRYTDKNSNIAGNFGILDQLMAMEWVKNNIKSFGGDPKQITLFGESAGAMSVGLHLFSIPKSNDLFRAGIMESNVMSVPYANADQASKIGSELVSLLCDIDKQSEKTCSKDINWLQSLSVKTVMQSQIKTLPNGMIGMLLNGMSQGTLWAPTVGVAPITGQPKNGYNMGNKPKPYMFGFNQNEAVFFTPKPAQFSNDDYKNILIQDFGEDGYKKILSYEVNGKKPYNPSHYKFNKASGMTPAAQAIANVMTHYAFSTGMLFAANNTWDQMQASKVPLYGYYFAETSTFNYQKFKRCGPNSGNVCHTYELPFVFHNFVVRQKNGQEIITKNVSIDEYTLSNKMVDAWVGFAKNPMNWTSGLGYPPLSSVDKGEYINWKGTDKPIKNLIDVVNYKFWLTVKSVRNIWIQPLVGSN